jgi:hypothetical protein
MPFRRRVPRRAPRPPCALLRHAVVHVCLAHLVAVADGRRVVVHAGAETRRSWSTSASPPTSYPTNQPTSTTGGSTSARCPATPQDGQARRKEAAVIGTAPHRTFPPTPPYEGQVGRSPRNLPLRAFLNRVSIYRRHARPARAACVLLPGGTVDVPTYLPTYLPTPLPASPPLTYICAYTHTHARTSLLFCELCHVVRACARVHAVPVP